MPLKETLLSLITKRERYIILDVGSGYLDHCSEIFKFMNPRVIRMDANKGVKPDVVHNIKKQFPKEHIGKYDLVFVSHVLEHIERNEVVNVTKNIAEAVKPGGQLMISVPALEWAAKQLMSGLDTTNVQLVLYGEQINEYQYHRCGFTLAALKALVEKELKDFEVQNVWREPFQLGYRDKIENALQNIVLAVKNG